MHEMSVVFLGTSSARPTLKRNTASVAVSWGPDTVLFDCGEGTQTQLLRSTVRPSRLRAVCITHFHGDHINGLPGLLGTMGLNGHEEPVTVAGPVGLDSYFATLRRLSILRPSFPVQVVRNTDDVVFETPHWRIRTCGLEHRGPTRGYLFEERDLPGRFQLERARELGIPPGALYGQLQKGHAVTLEDGRTIEPHEVMGGARRGRRVAYISDTRPTAEVIDFVAGADLLIHEATYTHDFAAEAHARGHSTARQAAQVALAAGVGRLVLTHFSTKYLSTAPLVEEARDVFPETSAARDLAEYTLGVPD